MEKEKKDAFESLRKAIAEAKESLGKKCEHCGCYDGIHKSDCLFLLKLR
jgi:hypothetical protein